MQQNIKQGSSSIIRWIFYDGFIAPLSVFLVSQAVLWFLVAIYSILTDTWRFWFFIILEGLSLLGTFVVWWRRP